MLQLVFAGPFPAIQGWISSILLIWREAYRYFGPWRCTNKRCYSVPINIDDDGSVGFCDLVLKDFGHDHLLFALFAAILPTHPSQCPPASLTTLFTPNPKHIASL